LLAYPGAQDGAEYHRLVSAVAGRVEACLRCEVLADRLRDPRHLSEDGRAWLAPWRTARRRFHQEYWVRGAAPVIGRADVRECFPSISG